MKKNITIFNIADWFLTHEPMTHKKLQKMLYFSYGYYITTYNNNSNNLKNELFENDFEAWVHGPVSPKIYNLYKESGYNYISKDKVTPIILDEKTEIILYFVLEKYKKYDGNDLELITHNQIPWLKAREGIEPTLPCNNHISSKDIFEYFKENHLYLEYE